MNAGKALLKRMKIGFLGTGNMGQAIISALIDSGEVEPGKIFVTDIIEGRAKKVGEKYGVNVVNSGEELVDGAEVVFLAVKPQDMVDAIEPIAMSFGSEHIVLSLAAGFSSKKLKQFLPQVHNIVRIMPNTPIRIRKSVVGYALSESSELAEDIVKLLLEPLGYVVPVEEGEPLEGLTVACGSGPGFVFELMKYWQDWLEDYGFEADVARKMTVETFLGSALLAKDEDQISLNELQERVVSKKGVTEAGLESLRENEVERVLRLSFEKAVLRDRELGQ